MSHLRYAKASDIPKGCKIATGDTNVGVRDKRSPAPTDLTGTGKRGKPVIRIRCPKQFECDVCGLLFDYSDTMKEHHKKQHGLLDYVVKPGGKGLVTWDEMIPKPSKMKNIKTQVDGITFDSTKEARRYQALKVLEAAGELTDLKLQFRIDCLVNGILVCYYLADFAYYCRKRKAMIFEDVKSFHTRKLPVYRIKKKLVFATSNIQITEV